MWIHDIHLSQVNHTIEVADGELGVITLAISPYRPEKQGIDDFGELTEEVHKIEEGMVVHRHHHTHRVEALGIALVVFYRIDITMENIGIVEHQRGIVGCPLHQIVIVRIHTGNHILTYSLFHQAHDGRLLAPGEHVAGREHHLKKEAIVLQTCQYSAPKEHIVIALHIGHNLATGMLGAHPVGGFHIAGGHVFVESLSHGLPSPTA